MTDHPWRDEVVLRIGGLTWTGLILSGIISLGGVPLILWLVTRRTWPKRIDREGLTLRNGKRLLWSEMTRIDYSSVQGCVVIVVRPINMFFGPKGKQVAQVIPRTLANRQEVMAFLGEVIPPRFRRGASGGPA